MKQQLKFPLLKKIDQEELYEALNFMNISELKNICGQLSLSEAGKKGELINKIMVFIKTGKLLQDKKMPEKSLAKNYPPQPLHENALMLYGSYKNDARTRALFKKLIGQRFHFTAFGIDWLNERWGLGSPPTYKEFAQYWIQETLRRKSAKQSPKKEWAYINFLQQAAHSNSQQTKSDLLKAWKKTRLEKKQAAQKIINQIISTIN